VYLDRNIQLLLTIIYWKDSEGLLDREQCTSYIDGIADIVVKECIYFFFFFQPPRVEVPDDPPRPLPGPPLLPGFDPLPRVGLEGAEGSGDGSRTSMSSSSA